MALPDNKAPAHFSSTGSQASGTSDFYSRTDRVRILRRTLKKDLRVVLTVREIRLESMVFPQLFRIIDGQLHAHEIATGFFMVTQIERVLAVVGEVVVNQGAVVEKSVGTKPLAGGPGPVLWVIGIARYGGWHIRPES